MDIARGDDVASVRSDGTFILEGDQGPVYSGPEEFPPWQPWWLYAWVHILSHGEVPEFYGPSSWRSTNSHVRSSVSVLQQDEYENTALKFDVYYQPTPSFYDSPSEYAQACFKKLAEYPRELAVYARSLQRTTTILAEMDGYYEGYCAGSMTKALVALCQLGSQRPFMVLLEHTIFCAQCPEHSLFQVFLYTDVEEGIRTFCGMSIYEEAQFNFTMFDADSNFPRETVLLSHEELVNVLRGPRAESPEF